LDGLIGAKLSELAATIRARNTEGPAAAARITRTDVGMRTMDNIRALLSVMRDEESRLYTEREIRMQGAARTAAAVNIAGLVVAFVLVLGATVLTIRGLRYRAHEHALRQTSEAVAAASQESEARLRTTLESIGDGVIATDDEGRVTLMNPVAQALTGWADAGARGRAGEGGPARCRNPPPSSRRRPASRWRIRWHRSGARARSSVSPTTRSSWRVMGGRSPSPTAPRRSGCPVRACKAWWWSSAT